MNEKNDIPVIQVQGDQTGPERFFKLYRLKNTSPGSDNLSYATFKTNRPHRHHFFEILIFERASGRHEIDFITYPVKNRSIHFISPGQIHYLSVTGDSQGYILAFTNEFYSYYEYNQSGVLHYPFFQSAGKNNLILPKETFQKIFKIVLFILLEYQHEKNPQILHGYLKMLMLELQRIYEHHFHAGLTPGQEEQIFHRFLQILESEFKSKKPVSAYAAMLNVRTGMLNKALRKISGKSAGELILDRLILEAKRLLHHSTRSQKEIAYGLNFEDPSYFSRIFKRKTGHSPSEFRKQMNKRHQL